MIRTVSLFCRLLSFLTCLFIPRKKKRTARKWRRCKGVERPKRHELRRALFRQKLEEDRQLRLTDYDSQLRELEKHYKADRDGNILWQATLTFSVLCELMQCLRRRISKPLKQICAEVGARTIRRPCVRVVHNVYTAWRLTRRFKPLHRGRTTVSILDERPILKRKAIKWTRRRIFKRKENEPALTSAAFLKFINELFIKYDVFINPDAPAADRKHLQWKRKSEYTALKYMHKQTQVDVWFLPKGIL